MAMLSHAHSHNRTVYSIGDFDRRPWGSWLVTDLDEQNGSVLNCEKVIVVDPGHILSLQSHRLRHETWTVLDGVLVALVDGNLMALKTGQSTNVPIKAVHCMANLSRKPCIVKERQQGICREDDITRYLDANGRPVAAMDENVLVSARLYKALIDEAGKRADRKEREYV